MTHLSQHDLWGTGSNTVAVLPPNKGDLFVVVMVQGRVALTWAVAEYERAVQVAQGFARKLREPQPVALKVLCLTMTEAEGLGIVPGNLFAGQTPRQAAEWRQVVIASMREVLRDCDDPKVRADALKLLTNLGAIPT